jgi:hypothetical protein
MHVAAALEVDGNNAMTAIVVAIRAGAIRERFTGEILLQAYAVSGGCLRKK